MTNGRHTCTEAYKGSSHKHVDLVLGGGQVDVRVVDVGKDVDAYGADQRLSPGPVIGPQAKQWRG